MAKTVILIAVWIVSPFKAGAMEGAEMLLRYYLFLLLIGTWRFKSVLSKCFFSIRMVYTLPYTRPKTVSGRNVFGDKFPWAIATDKELVWVVWIRWNSGLMLGLWFLRAIILWVLAIAAGKCMVVRLESRWVLGAVKVRLLHALVCNLVSDVDPRASFE